MSRDGSASKNLPKPLWLCAELTYACPLQCPYCSNPVDFSRQRDTLKTEDWIRVLQQARLLGAVQLGFSGGEPLLRRDLETLVAEGRRLGYYTNLITSASGLGEERLKALKQAGLDHIQISFQAGARELSDFMAATEIFEHKLAAAKLVKQYGYDIVLNFVVYRDNIEQIEQMLEMAAEVGADHVELANVQYYGWAFLNRDRLLPTRDQLQRAEAVAHDYQRRWKGRMRILWVVPDYYEERPKACMNGWGSIFLTVAPDGVALPCQAARQLPGLEFPNVREHSVDWIWNESPAFNRFRGFDWMKEPCRSCPERFKDFGGCRCQAYMLTGDPANTDPVCSLSLHHDVILSAVASANSAARAAKGNHIFARGEPPVIFRNARNSIKLSG
jgi:pyrroloquinoline quinone biosynthesis protein E